MSISASDRPGKRFPVIALVVLIILAALGAGAYFLRPLLERAAPRIELPDAEVWGLAPMNIRISDQGTGLKSVTATLSTGTSQVTLFSEQYDQPVAEKTFTVALASKLGSLKEGSAVLRVSANDGSLWNFPHGNQTVTQKNVTIDVTPPTIELVAGDRYINFGGAGVITYKTSADAVSSGVRIGNRFFPGFPGQVKNHPERFVAIFAHPYDAPADAKGMLVATDRAGNSVETPLTYILKNVKYRKSTIRISDTFVQKVAHLLSDPGTRQGSPKEIFVRINKDLRKENEDKIAAITRNPTPTRLWSGAFRQLSNSKVEANFADFRTYTYENDQIDEAYHLGYDLSVTKHYPIEASNSGTVAFAGDLGIYGNTVILDHGLGLYTLYAHMSSIDAQAGDKIDQAQILGKTGETGLAGGDHLHFGVYLHGIAVLPVEWWDPKWIDDNVESKLGGSTGDAQPTKASRKAKRKQRR